MNGRISFLRDTKRIGDVSEVTVLAALVREGYRVLQPYGENSRYDLVIERDGVFSRVQVKTGRLRNGAVLFNAYSSHAHRGGAATRGYHGEIEFFGVYCPDTEGVYLVPVDDIMLQGFLRVVAPRNGQVRNVRWADRYRLGWRRATQVVGAFPGDGVTLGSPEIRPL